MGFGKVGGKSAAWGLRALDRNARRPLHPSRVPYAVRRQSGRSSGVEHNLAKVGVEGSNPFARSILAAQSIRGIDENENEARPADWRMERPKRRHLPCITN